MTKKKPPKQPPALVRGFAFDNIYAQAKAMRWGERQIKAAQLYRDNSRAIMASGASTLDPDRIVGGGQVSFIPADHKLEAARILAKIKATIGTERERVLGMVVVEGMTLREVGRSHGSDRQIDANVAGEVVRDALTMVADEFYPLGRPSGIRSTGAIAEVRAADAPSEITPGRVHLGGRPRRRG